MEFQLFPSHYESLSLNNDPKFTGKRKISLFSNQERDDFKKLKLYSPTEKKLTLSFKSFPLENPTKIKQRYKKFDTIDEAKLRSFRFYTKEDEIAEANLGFSTKLGLHNHSWKIKKHKEEKSDTIDDMSEQRIIEEKLKSFKFYTKEDEIEEKSLGISTKLLLFEDPWKIKKVLTISDTNGLSRLMISSNLIRSQVLPLMENDTVESIETGVGARVNIWDYDCRCLYQLTLKRWEKNRCYIFNNNWTATIVNGRGLTAGDEIGLFWDRINNRFGFRVLSRGARGGSKFCDNAYLKNR